MFVFTFDKTRKKCVCVWVCIHKNHCSCGPLRLSLLWSLCCAHYTQMPPSWTFHLISQGWPYWNSSGIESRRFPSSFRASPRSHKVVCVLYEYKHSLIHLQDPQHRTHTQNHIVSELQRHTKDQLLSGELHQQIESISGFSVQSLMQTLTTNTAIQFHSRSEAALEMK